MAFKPDSIDPIVWQGRRSQGRPRQAWAASVYTQALEVAGDAQQLSILLDRSNPVSNYAAWQTRVRRTFDKLIHNGAEMD